MGGKSCLGNERLQLGIHEVLSNGSSSIGIPLRELTSRASSMVNFRWRLWDTSLVTWRRITDLADAAAYEYDGKELHGGDDQTGVSRGAKSATANSPRVPRMQCYCFPFFEELIDRSNSMNDGLRATPPLDSQLRETLDEVSFVPISSLDIAAHI